MNDEARWIDGDLLHCSFCGRAQKKVAKLIAGPGVYICSGCVTLARSLAGGLPTRGGRAASAAAGTRTRVG